MFPARKAPAKSKFSFNDGDGTHHGAVGADGVFKPADEAEEQFAISMGWPVIREKPETPAKPAKSKQPKPAKPAKPGAAGEGTNP